MTIKGCQLLLTPQEFPHIPHPAVSVGQVASLLCSGVGYSSLHFLYFAGILTLVSE
jgi:hypothetical protein